MRSLEKEDILEKINNLRKQDINNFQTNYFMNELSEDLICLDNANAIIVLSKDRDIYRLYFATINLLSFEELLKQLPTDIKISLEIITKKDVNQDLYNCINKYLPFDTIFERMRCKVDNLKVLTNIDVKDINYAKSKDLNFIYNVLYNTFNYYSSHLPSINELKKLQTNKNIIITKNDDKISSFIIMKNNSRVVNFDQLVGIDKNPFNLMKIIDSLNLKLKSEEFNDVFLWVDSLFNKDVIKLHKLYGYRSDNTKDYYFINDLLKSSKI